jgi:hypothetical protein
VPEELREAKSLGQFKSIEDLLKGYVQTKAMVGAKSVVVPSKNATPEQREEFFKAIGRPDQAAEYDAPASDALPDGYTMGETDLNHLRTVAHGLGLSKAQGEQLIGEYAKLHAQQLAGEQQQMLQRHTDAEKQLRAEWGGEFDARLDTAKLAIKELGGDALVAELESSRLGDHPEIVKAFYKVGQMIGDDPGLVTSGTARLSVAPVEAKQKIAQLKSDSDFIRRRDRGEKGAVDEWNRLHQIAYSSTS